MEEECVTPHTTEVLYCEAELGYKEIELYDTKLRVYPNGDIWRLYKGGGKGFKKGEWKIAKVVANGEGYLHIEIDGHQTKCHRIVGYVYLGLDITNTKLQIDHKNRIRNDNRVENLEIVTNQQNCFNKSNVKGYCFYKKTGKYHAKIYVNGKNISLGYYDTPEEASAKYYEAKAILHII
jgi:hypothetical protein